MKITKETSYMLGLFQTDGHHAENSRNRGKFTLELSIKDKDIIYKIAKLIPYNYSIFDRKRKTNFSKLAHSIGIRICDWNFRKWLIECGVPCGNKTQIIKPPLYLENLSVDNYVRGLWDGDGSVGFTARGTPFASFTTYSIPLRDFLEGYISKTIGNTNHHFTKPKRDNVYNIMLNTEDAVNLVKSLYPNSAGNTSIERKFLSAQSIKGWERAPSFQKKKFVIKKKWQQFEDEFLIKNGVEKSTEILKRSKKAIQKRYWLIKKLQNLTF